MSNIISKLRKKLGHDKFIHPAARIIIENEKSEILFIQKKDSGLIGIPAGSLEENETIQECIIREVREETGLEILDLEVIGISSSPTNETVTYKNGDEIQYFTVEFYSNSWKGELTISDKDEISKVEFKDRKFLNNLPKNEKSTAISLDYFKKEKRIRLN